MKSILLFVACIFLLSIANCQTEINIPKKNRIHYTANTITEAAVKDYTGFNYKDNLVYEKVLGTEVDIYIDTVFKKYTVLYKDKEYKSVAMIYEYMRDYFTDNKDKSPDSKIYLMDMQGAYFMLADALNMFDMLEMIAEKKLANNCTWIFNIKNAVRVE